MDEKSGDIVRLRDVRPQAGPGADDLVRWRIAKFEDKAGLAGAMRGQGCTTCNYMMSVISFSAAISIAQCVREMSGDVRASPTMERHDAILQRA